jgi:16S rRNA (guanine(527)-N(7))-methyltransferase RsmG
MARPKSRSEKTAAEAQIDRLQLTLSELQHTGELPFPPPDPQQLQQLTTYTRLLLEWNQRMNLISPNDEDRIAERHILESLAPCAAWDFPPASRVLDLGSGGGLPGIPLKIMRPDLAMTLLESRQKKALFLNTVVRELLLENCRVLSARAEELAQTAGESFSIISARAVADLKTLWRWSKPLLAAGGALLAMKGGSVDEEMAALKSHDPQVDYRMVRYPKAWKVEASRFLVIISSTAN